MLRFLVYRSAKSPAYLCVCSARDAAHALKIAKQNGLTLHRSAFAVREI